MAKFYDLKIFLLKKELEQRGLVTNGLKTELQSRLREAMEAENINVDEYVFQLELEVVTIKEETRLTNAMDLNMILAAKSQMSTQISTEMSTQFKEQFAAQNARISLM